MAFSARWRHAVAQNVITPPSCSERARLANRSHSAAAVRHSSRNLASFFMRTNSRDATSRVWTFLSSHKEDWAGCAAYQPLGNIAGHPGDRMRKRPCNSGESGVEIAVIMEEIHGDPNDRRRRPVRIANDCKDRVMATYMDSLKAEQLRQMDGAVTAFLDSYAAPGERRTREQ